MKDRLMNILRSFTAAMADAALSTLLVVLMLSLYDAPRTVSISFGVWAGTLLLQAVVNEFLAGHSPSVLLYILVNTALILASHHAVITRTVFIPGSHGFPILLGILIICCGIHAAFAASKLPGSDFFVRMTDTLIISTGLYLAAAFSMGKAFHTSALLFVLFTFACLLITTASLRAGGESDSVIRGTGIGGWLVLGALFVFCLLFTAVLLALGSGHVNSLVDAIRAIWSMLSGILSAVTKVLIYVLALLIRPGKMQSRAAPEESMTLPDIEAGSAAPLPPWVGYLFFALIALLIAGVVIAILFALHSMKFSRVRIARRRRRVTRKSHFFSALFAMLRRIAGRISFEIAYRAARRTPQGLLVLAQRTGRLHRLAQKTGESGGAYLRRLHAVLVSLQLPSELHTLAAQLDAVFYGGQTVSLTEKQYAVYAAQIRSIRSLPKEKPEVS